MLCQPSIQFGILPQDVLGRFLEPFLPGEEVIGNPPQQVLDGDTSLSRGFGELGGLFIRN